MKKERTSSTKPRPVNLGLEDKIRRVKESQPKEDPSGKWFRAIDSLAREFAHDLADLVDEWSHRAQVIEYSGAKRDVAEMNAFEHLRERIMKKCA